MKESDEGELRWFKVDEIPFDMMWKGDNIWVPLMLDGKKFEGELIFNEDGNELIKHELRINGKD